MSPDTVTTHGLPYDYDSVMHYSMTAFSKDKAAPTIIPRVSQYLPINNEDQYISPSSAKNESLVSFAYFTILKRFKKYDKIPALFLNP